ncbi:hypothetical protein [Marinobacter sp. SS21]|uniref:hypothetical protein n=1 Tax=Marinobacter sp. SS21 TaxID=2979460 RepID=UPI00232BA51C|nr:hypothetical protein [Marinobacter sp. SS21]MDC0661563.1 hypothetical protein [Marinobacter sp. SS21]
MAIKLPLVLIGLCAPLAMIYGIGELADPTLPDKGTDIDTGQAVTAQRDVVSAAESPNDAVAAQRQRLVQQLAIELLEQFGEDIDDRAVQSRLLEVRNRVIAAHPQDGRLLFERAVMLAFPMYANEIFGTLDKLVSYQQWLASNDLMLSEMPYLEREGAKWNKRLALFGTDAERIWAEEHALWASKQRAVRHTIETLDQARQYSLDETLFQLQSQLEQSYGVAGQAFAPNRGLIAQVFFGLDSVQSRLKALPAEQRQRQIDRIRSQLGYSEAQVQRLADRDQQREDRWQRGLAYMAARQPLEARLSGPQLERALASLRQEYFRHEAATIALEERDGFFRYQRPRLYGRN